MLICTIEILNIIIIYYLLLSLAEIIHIFHKQIPYYHAPVQLRITDDIKIR